ncbi:hypothetical protein IGW14_32665 [Streptomyces hygroscopicus subsp. hygroscopicus]|uniref:hypothetical protein n=1 Tax=Streptomyces TaxID=1883 RepID=UPI001C6567C0|nr:MULTISPECIES: hypothetical protein [Streptomyces]MBW8092598.1 hypothetical protein [Streptomyces hygroscopicus subsp. hygroscopicus]MCO8304587.1 hypothetical protein [Streptomyces sp. RKCA744]
MSLVMVGERLPRHLRAAESGVLNKLLAVQFPGARQLRQQVPQARVVGRWGSDSPSVDLEVMEPFPRAGIPDGVVPVTGAVKDSSGELDGELLLWVSDGTLSALEYSWYTDEAPVELPDPRGVTVAVQR